MSITAKSIQRGLERGSKTSKIDIGEVYGRLTVYGLYDQATAETQAFGKRVWVCKCRCGNWIKVRADRIAYGARESCGCKAVEATRRQLRRYEARMAQALERLPNPIESARLAARFGE